jgi:hypothetical protein
MALIYPNIVPENNLRLPDALTIKYGPAPLLARFLLEGDKAARQSGIRLRLRHDFDELLYVNKQQIACGNWYRLPDNFNPEYTTLSPENSYWISGEDEQGEIVLTQAGHVYYWPETSLEQEAHAMFYAGRGKDQLCRVTSPAAKLITGVVFCAGSHWIRPDHRGRKLSHLLARVGRAYAVSRWPVDWAVALVAPVLVEKGVSAGYGYKHGSRSVYFPDSPWGNLEFVLAYLSAGEAYADLAQFLAAGISCPADHGCLGYAGSAAALIPRDDNVTRISSDGVFHGSSSRS